MTSEWRLDINPGFKTKIIRIGNNTAEILRPLLDEKEEARRKKDVEAGLLVFAKEMERSVKHE